MHTDELRRCLDDPQHAAGWLRTCGIDDVRRGHRNLVGIATSGMTLDLVTGICEQLTRHLPGAADPDMALNNFERFVAATRSPLSLGSLLERDPGSLEILLQMFATSQHLSDLLITDPESYDLLRITEGQPVSRDVLVEEIAADVAALPDDASVLATLRRYKRRETLRIAYGDIVSGQSLPTVTEQISFLADALIEASVRVARRKLVAQRGEPRRPDGARARFVFLALGKLGGTELNYSSDIDLIGLFDEGKTDGPRPHENGEFFARLTREVVRLLTEPTDQGVVYRVDLRLRPNGRQGPVVHSVEQALRYYDVSGRTWERQALIKARAVAGDLTLGQEFLTRLEPWIYRRYLGVADIGEIKALKRRIEQGAIREGTKGSNVKTGQGGIRDIEFAIQFLQLLHGGDLPEVRTANTLSAIERLQRVGCLTHQEQALLEQNYLFLRRIEHLLQILFDLQTHLLRDSPSQLHKLARRLGYRDEPQRTALDLFEEDYRRSTQVNRRILDHLLHDAFGGDAAAEPEVDLVLDPQPDSEQIDAVLGRYRFRDTQRTYRNLMSLATERIRFLSPRRCRHFLASIAPRLLRSISATPDPDATLVTLDKVSDSLGGKGVLWESFSLNPPTLKLYVELCATSPYLSGILISNPGMFDELIDSLVLNKLPQLESLRETLADLCRGAEDLEPILHSFKNAQQLRVGVRDILGKEDIAAITGSLSDIARVCLEQITKDAHHRLVERWGTPTIDGEEHPHRGEPAELVILALGKFGGRELNYHSDLDVVFLYDADGHTVREHHARRETTTNQHFFGELASRVVKSAGRLGPYGRLYEIDARLRPTGRSGILATSLDEFQRYFASGQGQLWERQALCKAGVIYGSPDAARRAGDVVARAAFGPPWQPENLDAIRHMRARLEESAPGDNIKRGPGGIVDIEFLVQMLQLHYAGRNPSLRHARTLTALEAVCAAGHLTDDEHATLADSYRLLRKIEGRLRLMNSTARDNLPEEEEERDKLARLVGYADGVALDAARRRTMQRNRELFEKYFAAAGV